MWQSHLRVGSFRLPSAIVLSRLDFTSVALQLWVDFNSKLNYDMTMDKGMTMNVNVTETRLYRMPNPRQGGYKTKSRIYINVEYLRLSHKRVRQEIEDMVRFNPENFNNRRKHPLSLYRKSALKALDKLEIDRSKLSVKWSQKAGCRCGCSPGFIVDGWDSTLDGKNLYVTITYN